MKKGITVILCTFNGAARLPKTIDHLAAQKVSGDLNWELIVVDNASTDRSSEVVKTLWEQHNNNPRVSLNLALENTPGKLFAFQKGIALAKYEYFIICDDDNWLKADYVQTAFDILEKNMRIGALGGQALAATTSILPYWFKAVQEGYAVGTQAKNTGDVTSKGMLWGAGLSSRTQLYKDMYDDFPSLLIDKNDHRILTAEDSEYCLRLVLKGYQLYYDSRLSLHHYIPDGRLTLTYKNSLFDNFKKANLIIDNYFIAIKYKLNISLLNRIRLTLITPIRYFLASNKQKKYRQRIIMCYLFPFIKPDPTTAKIKAFMNK
ncbi:glycosyltransferase [Pedobacter sp. ASV1-7]|uniref:glycosyltransferase n=1 Tax=Pedobacter sp. ASV1-7 TaxID=3145237 RepID=UPI0032E8D16B